MADAPVTFKGLSLDKFQIEAINAVNRNESVVVSAPTGSGKTLIADYIIDRDIKRGVKVIYTAPIKALSNQKYKDFCRDYGETNIGLITGDIVVNPEAPVLIMTTEIYRNMVITKDPSIRDVNYVVLDEIHYINDIERGTVWEESIIFAPKNVRFLFLSATIPNAGEFASWVQAIKGHEVVTIKHHKRAVPLKHFFFDIDLGICTLDELREAAELSSFPEMDRRGRLRRQKVKPPSHIDAVREVLERGNAPAIYFVFSRAATQKKSEELVNSLSSSSRSSFSSFSSISSSSSLAAPLLKPVPAIVSFVNERFSSLPAPVRKLRSASLLRRVLSYGVAFHHAGMLPALKSIVEDLFERGMIKVLYATETFAVGINMPAKTVLFDSPDKFDGVSFRMMNTKEYFQMAGRAGRRGIDKVGYSIILIYRPTFSYKRLKELVSGDKMPIRSQFRLSVNTVLNLISKHTPEEIRAILKQSFASYQKYGSGFDARTKHTPHYTFQKLKRKLKKMGYVANDLLTEKGVFASKIFSDEILTSEIFATDFWRGLSVYQTMLMLAAIVYEFSVRDRFKKQYPESELFSLHKKISAHPFLRYDDRFRHLKKISALVKPCFLGESFFEILEKTTFLEGDLIRFFRQLLDRISQIKKAAFDYDLVERMQQCEAMIINCMKDVEVL